MSFRTSHFLQATLQEDAWVVARRYAKTWMIPDLCIITVDWAILLAYGSGNLAKLLRASRALKAVRCVRLLRLMKLQNLVKPVQDQVSSNLMHLSLTLFKLVFSLITMIHLITCGWYAIGASSETGWKSYHAPDVSNDSKDIVFWYTAAARWTLAQINGRTDLDER
eukprot:CAMPEP_0170638866 /NCGR_PEP_ID=MMETSP0224-20130122/39310_1 /TAXON_ID=285029 /ORGANISM="Togula jolla, Strain CCCM 725" /LENGTH=165 /DNA_ID=CAMNT_0010969115 /DNA_START=42 /DNA_END=536 /DNA_ORIENTATION=+